MVFFFFFFFSLVSLFQWNCGTCQSHCPPLFTNRSKMLCGWDSKVTVLLLWLKSLLIAWDWCLCACSWSTAIVRGASRAKTAQEGFNFPPLPIYDGGRVCWSLIQGMAAVGNSVAQGLRLRECVFNLQESESPSRNWGLGKEVWVCSVALLILGPVASWGFEMEAKNDRDGRQHRAWNKGCSRAVSLYYTWVDAVTLLFWVKSKILYWLKMVLEISTSSW